MNAFLVLLNDHVAALASKLPQDCPVGKMQLVFIQPSTGAVAERRYCVGDVEAMLGDVRVYAHTHNVYIGGRTIRDDAIIAPGGRGKFEATGLVYALVVDDDTGVFRNDVASTLHVKTSKARCHKWLLFDTFVSPEAAAALGLRLNRFVGADHCTGSVAHVYRVPGTPNWPNAKKIAEGRKPEPTSLSLQRGELWSPEALLNSFPHVDELPQEEGMPQRAEVAPRDDDDAIIEKAKRAANADKFNVLWRGDRAEFNYGHDSRGIRYNKSATGDVSDSMADRVLARMLAFYTSDPAQIDSLMRRSGLYRAKWDSRRGGGTWLSEFVIKSAIKTYTADAAKKAARVDAIRPSVERAMARHNAEQATTRLGAALKQKPPPGGAANSDVARASSNEAHDPPGELLRVALDHPAPIVKLTRASSLKPEPISWLWPGWLARRKMHIVGGQPGAGKTTIAMCMAATLTTGGRWPDGSHSPLGNVVIWSGEDDPADTLVPRLLASGADMDRIYFVDEVIQGADRRPFDPSKDMEGLEKAIADAGGCAMIIVDPVVNAVAGDSHKNTETRRALQPLVDLAASANAALLGITHFSKGTAGREPIERITGSIAFGAIARVVMIAAKEGETDDGSPPRRFLARAKNNIGPDEGGFAYELRQEPMPGDARIIASIAAFGEAIEGTARDMLAAAEAESSEDKGAFSDAEDFLRKQLAEGPVATKELHAAAAAHAIGWRTVERAKQALGVEAFRHENKWSWRLTPPNTPTSNSWRSCGLTSEEGEGEM
ncbi:AAA family ATPase [Methylocystis sp.]|uniref:phage NrS-1 polymerase family protein n=1 Tax=Methylocystis sp. TaxID=1911079 RepID=UPI003D12CFB8